MQRDTSLWASLGSLAGILGGVAVLWGALLNWLRRPAEHRLITVQTEVAEATKGKTEAERDSIAFNVVSKALQDAERTIDRLREERDAAEGREKLLALQLDREVRWRKGNGWPGPPDGKGS